jgi:glycosyltransferase involved in cell wall biosynthesis
MYANHHGYERIIKSIYRYYKNGGTRNIVYYCIGFGKELNKYKNLVSLYKLENHVIFPGEKNGEELDKYYNIAHIGLDFFGGYKENLNFISSLKTIEYLSRGIPVATGINVNVFDKNPCNFYIQFANDSSEINIEDLFRFYDEIYLNLNLHEEIRNYAIRNVDTTVVLQDVVKFINNQVD